MRVILKREVDRLGFPGDVVDVKDGYGRNYLLPRGLAVPATHGALRARQRVVEAEERREHRERDRLAKLASDLDGKTVVIEKKAGSGHKLYGSVTLHDIHQAIAEQLGLDVERKRLVLTEAIKTLGEHQRTFRIASGISAVLNINVCREGEAPPPVEKSDESSQDEP